MIVYLYKPDTTSLYLGNFNKYLTLYKNNTIHKTNATMTWTQHQIWNGRLFRIIQYTKYTKYCTAVSNCLKITRHFAALLLGSKGFHFGRKTDEMTKTGHCEENIDFW